MAFSTLVLRRLDLLRLLQYPMVSYRLLSTLQKHILPLPNTFYKPKTNFCCCQLWEGTNDIHMKKSNMILGMHHCIKGFRCNTPSKSFTGPLTRPRRSKCFCISNLNRQFHYVWKEWQTRWEGLSGCAQN